MQAAHSHEHPLPVKEEQISYPDIVVSEELVRRHEEFLLFCVYALLQAAVRTTGAIDSDVLAALEAVIQTHRTAESGLLYETRPENMVALAVQRSFVASLSDYQKLRAEREPLATLRSSEMLAIFVFLHRIGQQNQNGRPRGRMFLDLLRQMTPENSVEEQRSGIIV